jgi:hypothetical protein
VDRHNFDADPDPDPDLHQYDANPHADPTPTFTHVGKYPSVHTTVSINFYTFYQCQMCHIFST